MFSHLQRQWSPKITAIRSEMGPFKEREEISATPSRVGRKPRKEKGPEAAARVLVVTPVTKHRLRLLKLERIKDYLLMEEEFVGNQGFLKTWIFGLCCRN